MTGTREELNKLLLEKYKPTFRGRETRYNHGDVYFISEEMTYEKQLAQLVQLEGSYGKVFHMEVIKSKVPNSPDQIEITLRIEAIPVKII